jgi:hypothetical protein
MLVLVFFSVISLQADALIIPQKENLQSQRNISWHLETPKTEQPQKKKASLIQQLKLLIIKKVNQLQSPQREDVTERQKKLGKWSLVLGLSGIALLLLSSTIGAFAVLSIPAAIGAVILGAKSIKGNSNTAGLIGLIAGSATLVVIIIYTILVVAFFSSW